MPSQLRKDPILDRWVILSEERASRPAALVTDDPPANPDDCPFCEGHEGETLPELWALRPQHSAPDSPGWRIRVVPNRYPALDAECEPRSLTCSSAGARPFEALAGVGVHEVIVEGQTHTRSITELPAPLVRTLLGVYQERFRIHSRDARLATAVLIKNVGAAAGASIAHSHSQFIGIPVLPPRLALELDVAQREGDSPGGCVWCALLTEERRRQERIVHEGEQIIAFCPYAPRFPYETWLLPVCHAPHFHAAPRAELDELSSVLRSVLKGVEAVLPSPPYNTIIHTAPFRDPRSHHYHWRLEILPRVGRAAGFEQGTGLYINSVLPEIAARALRAGGTAS